MAISNVIYPSQVTPTILVSELEDVPVSVRKCLYPYEMEVLPGKSSLAQFDRGVSDRARGARFQRLANFSQSGCYYECMLEGATVASHCTPWLFPPARSDGNELAGENDT